MADKVYIGNNASKAITSNTHRAYTGVIIINGDTAVSAGDISGETGDVLEINNPYGTQAMADNVLAVINGYAYKSYEAQDALVSPAAELGDGVTIKGVYSGIFEQNFDFTALMHSTISARAEEDIDHEFPTRKNNEKYATYFNLANGLAKVAGSGIIDNSIINDKLANSTIRSGKIASGGVAYGNTAFTSTLDQVGTNASNIAAMWGYFTGSASFSALSISAAGFYVNGKYCQPNSITLSDGTTRNVLVWTY